MNGSLPTAAGFVPADGEIGYGLSIGAALFLPASVEGEEGVTSPSRSG
jgi:hypothetical protein